MKRNSKNPAGQTQAAEQQTPVDDTPPTAVQLGFSVFNHDPVKVNSMTDKTQASAAEKAERAAKLAELGGSPKMLALRSAKGRYVKAKNGFLRSDDDIAQAFDGLAPDRTIAVCMNLLGLDANPYAHLNIGQQSMNLRNKLRTAVKRGVISIDAVRAAAQS